jgi:hypothetical protein
MAVENYKKTKLYSMPEVCELVEKLRLEGDGFRTIANKVEVKFGEKINHMSIKNYFDAKEDKVYETALSDPEVREAVKKILDIPKQVRKLNKILRKMIDMDKMLSVKCPTCEEKFAVQVKNSRDDLAYVIEIRKQLEFVASLSAQVNQPIAKMKDDPISKAENIRRIVEEMNLDKANSRKTVKQEGVDNGERRIGNNNRIKSD